MKWKWLRNVQIKEEGASMKMKRKIRTQLG